MSNYIKPDFNSGKLKETEVVIGGILIPLYHPFGMRSANITNSGDIHGY